jgi:glycosyltransferase involved in cell wall biosynthesis
MMQRPSRPLVVHIVPNLFGGNGGVFGGAERYALELARHMADVVRTRLVTFGSEARRERIGALDVHVLGGPWLVRGQAHNPLHRGLFTHLHAASVVHCHQEHVLASSLSALLGRLTGKDVFVTDLGGGGWDLSAYVSTTRWFRGHLHISEYSRRIAGHEALPWAHVILGGIDTQRFSPDSEVKRDGSVVYVGRLLPHKGIDDLIRAMPADVPLELIGRPYHPEYLARLQSLAHGKRVTFRHDCTDTDIVNAYRRALCVVLPSVYRDCYGQESKVPELLGQTLLEGMACGTPATCTDVASMPELVQNGRTGFIVPPNNPNALFEKIAWLRQNPVAAEEFGQNARRHVLEHFTWPQVVERCLRVYGIEATAELAVKSDPRPWAHELSAGAAFAS